MKGLSKYEGIIDKVLGRQLPRTHHDLEWLNLSRWGGDMSLRAWSCPSCDAGKDQSGDSSGDHRILLSLSAKPNDATLHAFCILRMLLFDSLVSSVSTRR